jgi:mono/diheme cytochrome c family protein
MRNLAGGLLFWIVVSGAAQAQESVAALVERGATLYNARVGCWVCHAENGAGLVGPSLHFGPTPTDIPVSRGAYVTRAGFTVA